MRWFMNWIFFIIVNWFWASRFFIGFYVKTIFRPPGLLRSTSFRMTHLSISLLLSSLIICSTLFSTFSIHFACINSISIELTPTIYRRMHSLTPFLTLRGSKINPGVYTYTLLFLYTKLSLFLLDGWAYTLAV